MLAFTCSCIHVDSLYVHCCQVCHISTFFLFCDWDTPLHSLLLHSYHCLHLFGLRLPFLLDHTSSPYLIHCCSSSCSQSHNVESCWLPLQWLRENSLVRIIYKNCLSDLKSNWGHVWVLEWTVTAKASSKRYTRLQSAMIRHLTIYTCNHICHDNLPYLLL